MKPGWKKRTNKLQMIPYLPRLRIEKIIPWIQLFKVPLCLPVAFSAGFGYLLHTPVPSFHCLIIIFGVFFLACGAAGLNSLQEIQTDKHLERTKNRPLVTGLLAPRDVIPAISVILLIGLLLLAISEKNIIQVSLGILAIVLYNGIYTPLKARTTFSLIPGACAGTIPPYIGWTGAGGLWDDYRIFAILLLFFMWQMPHFFMVLLKYKEDYQRKTSSSLINCFSEQSLKRISFIWLMGFICAALALTTFPGFLATGSRAILTLIPTASGVFISLHLYRNEQPNYQLLFLALNTALFLTMFMVACLQILNALQ